MTTINILARCEHNEGDCYSLAGEADSHTGERYKRCEPCPKCSGVDRKTKAVVVI